ncbi:MAG: Fur family transcriptional regulator [Atribacterota bacterium]
MAIAVYEEQFKYFLKKNNLKFTKERREVLAAIAIQQNHFNAEDIYQQLKKQKSNVSLATVYRTIPLLINSGLMTETTYGGERIIYEKIYNKPHHHHMVCINCGKIIDFTCPDVEVVQNDICQKNYFLSTEYRLEIKGYCQACRKKMKNKKMNRTFIQEFK